MIPGDRRSLDRAQGTRVPVKKYENERVLKTSPSIFTKKYLKGYPFSKMKTAAARVTVGDSIFRMKGMCRNFTGASALSSVNRLVQENIVACCDGKIGVAWMKNPVLGNDLETAQLNPKPRSHHQESLCARLL